MKTKTITTLGIGIALYVALSAMIKIPLVGHIQTDMGYIAFGVFCVLFGWLGAIVGVIGCLIESLIFSGWLPVGWMAGQLAIGVICGVAYKKTSNKVICSLITVVAVFIGIAIIKTGIECVLYSIPLNVKFVKNFTAFVADSIPMLIGMFLGFRLNKIRR